MIDFVAKTFAEYHDIVHQHVPYSALSRGVSDVNNHLLVPGIGRYVSKKASAADARKELEKRERDALRIFAVESASYLGRRVRSKWELLAIAQHHGLPTRLLDWTLNPLIALYFASRDGTTVDGAVYSVKVRKWIDNENEEKYDPYNLTDIHAFLPAHIAARIKLQHGVFTIQPDPTIPFDYPDMIRIVIPGMAKHSLQHTLRLYGISEKSLDDGLDGLAAFISRLKFKKS